MDVTRSRPELRLHRYTEVPHAVELVVPDRSYVSTRAPRLFNYASRDPDILSWFPDELRRTVVSCPDEYVIRLSDACVVQGHYLILRPDKALADTFNFDSGALDRTGVRAAGRLVERGEVERYSGGALPVFHIFKDIYYNYGHMLVEVLPKLLHIEAMGIRDFVLLFPWSALGFLPVLQYTADVLGLRFEHVVCYNNQLLHVAEVFWVGPVAHHDRRKSRTLRDLAQRLVAATSDAPSPRRLYVTRPCGANRPMPQQAALEDLARSAGYHVVEPSTLAFPEQVRLFHGADHVLGPMGAALANTVFMRPGARVSMLTSRRVDPFFWDIARLMDLRFDWVFTRDAEAWTPEMQTEPFDLDPARFAGMLAWLD